MKNSFNYVYNHHSIMKSSCLSPLYLSNESILTDSSIRFRSDSNTSSTVNTFTRFKTADPIKPVVYPCVELKEGWIKIIVTCQTTTFIFGVLKPANTLNEIDVFDASNVCSQQHYDWLTNLQGEKIGKIVNEIFYPEHSILEHNGSISTEFSTWDHCKINHNMKIPNAPDMNVIAEKIVFEKFTL